MESASDRRAKNPDCSGLSQLSTIVQRKLFVPRNGARLECRAPGHEVQCQAAALHGVPRAALPYAPRAVLRGPPFQCTLVYRRQQRTLLCKLALLEQLATASQPKPGRRWLRHSEITAFGFSTVFARSIPT